MTSSEDWSQAFDDELETHDAEMLDLAASVGFDPLVIDRAIETGCWQPQTGEPQVIDEASRVRLSRVMTLMGLLEEYPVELDSEADGKLLVAATMARIDRHRMALRPESEADLDIARSARRRIRIPDFISVAAVLLIPVLQRVRISSMDMACADNLRRTATGFTLYAGDFGGNVPTFTAGASRLFPAGYEAVHPGALLDGGYCELGHLGCPGHHHDQTGPHGRMYGHQMVVPGQRMSWVAPVRLSVVIGDRSPLVDAFREGFEIAPEALSGSHGGRGQNVLQIDGAVLWLRMPVREGHDNLWLPHGMNRLQPGARPVAIDDAFIVH